MQKKGTVTGDQKKDVEEMQRNMLKRKAQLHEIEQTLPQKNSLYLKVSLYIMGHLTDRNLSNS